MSGVVRRRCEVAWLIIVGWAACVGFYPVPTHAAEQSATPLWLEASRPHPKGEPTKVTVGIYVVDIGEISDAQQTFSADFAVRLKWEDPRLAHDSEEPRMAALTDVWHPRIQILNARHLEQTFAEEVAVMGNGTVTYVQRFLGTLTVPLDLHRFPRDEQILPIKIVFAGVELDETELRIDENYTAQSPKFTIANWKLDEGLAHIRPIQFSPTMTRPSVVFEARAQRDIQYYRWKIVSTLVLIVLMSWGAFWISAADAGPQLAMVASSMLP